jgi:hypothetical protein
MSTMATISPSTIIEHHEALLFQNILVHHILYIHRHRHNVTGLVENTMVEITVHRRLGCMIWMSLISALIMQMRLSFLATTRCYLYYLLGGAAPYMVSIRADCTT